MPVLYVAFSNTLADWASDVGLSRNVYKVGFSEQPPKEAVEALCAESHAGQTDWRLLKSKDAGDVDQAAVMDRLGKKFKEIDPNYYPRIKGVRGIFRVKPIDVENSLFVKEIVEGPTSMAPKKLKPTDIADYLISNALR